MNKYLIITTFRTGTITRFNLMDGEFREAVEKMERLAKNGCEFTVTFETE